MAKELNEVAKTNEKSVQTKYSWNALQHCGRHDDDDADQEDEEEEK